MTSMYRRLGLALALSLLLHTLAFAPGLEGPEEPERPATPITLEARLQAPPAPPLEQPPLALPEPIRPKSSPRPPSKPARLAGSPGAAAMAGDWHAEAGRQLKELDRQGKFYPEEAISQGLEGEAIVLLILDETGNAVAARIEESCGHPILDAAALRAVRSLKSLPGSAPRKTLIPVRFILRR